MNADYLKKIANDPKYTYFINPSDAVSSALFSEMEEGTVHKNYINKFVYSPVTAHSLSQWFPEKPQFLEKKPEAVKILATGQISED